MELQQRYCVNVNASMSQTRAMTVEAEARPRRKLRDRADNNEAAEPRHLVQDRGSGLPRQSRDRAGASVVAQSCNYHAQAIRHLLTTELAQTMACSMILPGSTTAMLLHGAPSYSIKKLQRVQNNADRIVLEVPGRSHASSLLRTGCPFSRGSTTKWLR